MLVLSRKPEPGHDKIILQTSDGPITITICGFRSGSTVSVGISAPQTVPITRGELMPTEVEDDGGLVVA